MLKIGFVFSLAAYQGFEKAIQRHFAVKANEISVPVTTCVRKEVQKEFVLRCVVDVLSSRAPSRLAMGPAVKNYS